MTPTLSLEAKATQDVQEDTAWATFSVERESRDQAQAQREASAAMTELVAMAKRSGKLRVTTENLYTSPNYGKDSKITGWRTHFAVRIESTDTAQVAQTTADLLSKARLSGAGFFLSDAARTQAEKALIAAAVKEFEDKARVTAQAMGFSRTEYGDVAVNQSGVDRPGPRPLMMSARAGAMAKDEMAEPVSMEPGKTNVSVSVSGTVKLIK